MNDWDHLRVFLSVARHGQILAAARKLGVNHATIARRLDALEASLGVLLFERRPAGSVLTQAGEQLLPVAERIESEVLSSVEQLRREEAAVAGVVRIGVPDGLGNYYLAGELWKLTLRHPDLVVELVPLPKSFSLSRREADLAIVLDRPTEGRLIVSRMSDYSLSAYASQDYLATRSTPETADALASHAVVTGVEDLAYASALDYSQALEAKAGRIFRCASVMGQMEAVRSGAGIGVLHDFAARGMGELVRVLPKITFRRSYYLLAHPDTANIRRISVCREFLTELFREERRRFLPFD